MSKLFLKIHTTAPNPFLPLTYATAAVSDSTYTLNNYSNSNKLSTTGTTWPSMIPRARSSTYIFAISKSQIKGDYLKTIYAVRRMSPSISGDNQLLNVSSHAVRIKNWHCFTSACKVAFSCEAPAAIKQSRENLIRSLLFTR